MFSILVPTFNRSALITRAIESVLAQSFKNWELIIIDDGSTDNTEDVVRSYKDKRIRYVKKQNSGAADSRNYGAKHAKRPFLAFLDSDDTWDSKKLEKTVAFIEEYGDDKCYYSGFRTYDSKAQKIIREVIPEKIYDMHEALKNYNPIHAFSTFVVPSHSFKEIEGFDTKFKARQDVDLYYRLSSKWEFIPIPEILVTIYNNTQDRISATSTNRIDGFKYYLEKHGKEMNFLQRSFLAKRIVVLAWQNKRYLTSLQYLPLGLISILRTSH